MPAFQINGHNPKGQFYLRFDAKKQVFFNQQSLSELNVFRLYGNLPDNGFAINKLINALGQNTLLLETKKATLAQHAGTVNARQQRLLDEKKFYSDCEIRTNQLTLQVLAALVPLEQCRFETTSQFTAIQTQLCAAYDHCLSYVLTGLDPIKTMRLNALHTKIAKQKEKTLAALKALNLERHALLDNTLRAFYQEILDDFQAIQLQITQYQRPFLGFIEFANQSATEAYQNASYALESHKFGKIKPSDDQLWIFSKEQEDGSISTDQMTSMRTDYALKTTALLNTSNLKDFLEEEKKYRTALVTNNLLQKQKVPEPLLKDSPEACPINTYANALQFVSKDKTTYLYENPTQYYEPGDMFSAVGGASLAFAKYFEREMASKHPVMTAGMFLGASVTFGAAGFSGISLMPTLMKNITYHVSQYLTANGHLGLSTLQMQHVIESISHAWLKLTYSEGSFLHIAIMNGFALPKILYTFADTIINGIDNKDTLTQLTQRLIPEDMEGKTSSEKNSELLRNIILTSLVLGSAIGVGLGAELLTSISKAGLIHSGASAVNDFIGVERVAFTKVGLHQSITHEAIAIVSLLLTVKSAGLFLGKGALLFAHMKEPPTPTAEQHQAYLDQLEAVKIIGLLHDHRAQYDKNPISLGPKVLSDFKIAYQRFPDVEAAFKYDHAFLAHLGLSGLIEKKSRLSQVGTHLVAVMVWLTSQILGLITSPILLTAMLLSRTSEKAIANYIDTSPNRFYNKLVYKSRFFADKIISPVISLGLWPLIATLSFLLAISASLLGTIRGKSGITTFKDWITPWLTSKLSADAFKIPFIFIPRVIAFLSTPIKLTFMTTWEVIKRIPMMIISAITTMALIMNALFTPYQQKLALAALTLTVLKPILLPILYIAAQLTALFRGIRAMFQTDHFFAETHRQSVYHSWYQQFIRYTESLTMELQTMAQAAFIMKAHDMALNGIQTLFNTIKHANGTMMRVIRNSCMRQGESLLHHMEMERMGHLDMESTTKIVDGLGGRGDIEREPLLSSTGVSGTEGPTLSINICVAPAPQAIAVCGMG